MKAATLSEIQALGTPAACWTAVRDALWAAIIERVPEAGTVLQYLKDRCPDPMRLPWPPPEFLQAAVRKETGTDLMARMHEICEANRKAAYAPYQSLGFKIRTFFSGI